MKRLLITSACLLAPLCGRAAALATPLDELLHAHVHDGWVDYAAVKSDPKDLEAFLSAAAAVSRESFDGWPKAEQKAFIINLYNASMLKLVVDHYPIKSVKDISFAFGVFRKPAVRVWGRTMSLETLETDYARKLSDYRVHFALVCASKGCPPLRSEAYAGERVNEQLDDQARRFFSQRQKNRVDAGERTLYVSPIFKWFPGDFQTAGGPIGVASKYLPASQRKDLKPDFKVKYTDYDWSLNDAAEAGRSPSSPQERAK